MRFDTLIFPKNEAELHGNQLRPQKLSKDNGKPKVLATIEVMLLRIPMEIPSNSLKSYGFLRKYHRNH